MVEVFERWPVTASSEPTASVPPTKGAPLQSGHSSCVGSRESVRVGAFSGPASLGNRVLGRSILAIALFSPMTSFADTQEYPSGGTKCVVHVLGEITRNILEPDPLPTTCIGATWPNIPTACLMNTASPCADGRQKRNSEKTKTPAQRG